MAKEEKTKKASKKVEVKKEVKKTSSKTGSSKNKSVSNSSKTVTKAAPKAVKESKSANKTNTIIQEENHYGRTILAALLIVLIFVGGYFGVQYKKHGFKPEEKYVATADEKKFKEEYESLNGTTRSNGQKNKDIKIMEDNNIKYITMKEAAEILDSGSGVIYFGFAACPWCRNATPVLLNAMDASELDTIYYVNIRPDDDAERDLRDTWVLDSRNKARQSKEGEAGYKDVTLALANELNDYVLTTDKGKKVNTGQKRLSAPTVVAVKDGIVVGFHAGTVSGHIKDETGALRDLTKDEETELLNTYSTLIGKYLNSNCDEEC